MEPWLILLKAVQASNQPRYAYSLYGFNRSSVRCTEWMEQYDPVHCTI